MHLSEAVNNALAADDPRLAVEIVERQGMRLLDQGQSATLMALIEKLPPTFRAAARDCRSRSQRRTF
jgi:serine/threonine-protein kinase PknK